MSAKKIPLKVAHDKINPLCLLTFPLYCSGVPFLPGFIAEFPTVDSIANHVEHIAKVAGKSRVGIGSDFDGFFPPPIPGMEDVSQYHSLVSSKGGKGEGGGKKEVLLVICFYSYEIHRLKRWLEGVGQKRSWPA